MKTNCSPIPPVASDARKRTRESIHRPPPVWCPAFRLSSGAQHAKAWTPNALRRFALHALTLLCAAALFTHTAFAAKPPPPPPPPPSSGTLVLDYEYAGPNSAELYGLTVAPSGTIYASGTGYGASGDWHGIVLASSDSGSTWWNVLDHASVEWYTEFSGGIASDASGNLYVAGLLSDVNVVVSDRWIVRRSTDGGVTWAAADSFAMGSRLNNSGPTAITTDAAGDVYVAGHSVASGQSVWTIRKGVGGTSFSTVYQGTTASFSGAQALFAHPTAGLFAAGNESIVINNQQSWAWIVRRSIDGGTTWSTVDRFQLSKDGAGASGIGTDALGNL